MSEERREKAKKRAIHFHLQELYTVQSIIVILTPYGMKRISKHYVVSTLFLAPSFIVECIVDDFAQSVVSRNPRH